MIKTAVIGASGFIGSHLLKKYREEYPDCIGTSFSNVRDNLIYFDLRTSSVEKLNLVESGHNAVVIASALSNVGWCEAHPKESYQLNVHGTLNFVRQLAELNLKIIYLSSDYVFDGADGQYNDCAVTNPITEYGRQKAEVEREIPNITDNYIVLRLSKIYGMRFGDRTLIDMLAADLINNKEVTVATDQFFSPTYVEDVVKMVLLTQKLGVSGIFNLCKREFFSRYQIADKLMQALNCPLHLLKAVKLHTINDMKGRPLNTSLRPSIIYNELQDTLVSIDDVVRKFAEYYSKSKIIA